MTMSPSCMNLQQIQGVAAPGASYAQMNRNSMSLRKHDLAEQIRQQSAKPNESQDRKSNLVIFGVEELDSGNHWI